MTAKRRVRKVLASGEVRVYEYDRAPKRAREEAGSIGAALLEYRASPKWRGLAPVTQRNYLLYLKELERLARMALRDLRRGAIMRLRDAIAEARGPAAATLFVRATSAFLAWALDRELVDFNAARGIPSLAGGTLPAWTDAEAEAALRVLSEPLRRAVVLALHTAQRRGDLVRVTWTDIGPDSVRVRQQKTGAQLAVPLTRALRDELAAWRADTRSTTILARADGRPWTATDLSAALKREQARRGLPLRSIHGLRKLAAQRLAEAGCTTHEIAAVTGHRTLAMIQLYTAAAQQETLATAAVHRLEHRTTAPESTGQIRRQPIEKP